MNLVAPIMRIVLALVSILFLTSLWAVGQDKKRQSQSKPPPVYSGLEAARARYPNLFKPNFAKLSLVETCSGDIEKQSQSSPKPFRSGSTISFQLLITNSSKEKVVVYSELDPHIFNRPQMYRGEALVSYRKDTTERLQAKDRRLSGGRSNVHVLDSGKSITETISLDDWYEPLQPGRYELSVWHRFIWGGEWLESPTVVFEIEKPESLKVSYVCPRAQFPKGSNL